MTLRIEGIRLALRLEAITIGWMVTEAGISIGAGTAAHSLLLVAFGADSVIELISAGVLFHQLRREAAAGSGEQEAMEALKRRTGRIAGALLYALGLYVVMQAIYGLTHRHRAEISWWGLGVALIAAGGMPVLGKAKLRIAENIGSKALRADAMESLTCGYLSWVLFAGLAANAVFHWWWLDAAASLIIVPLLLREAKEAMTGECCDHCHESADV